MTHDNLPPRRARGRAMTLPHLTDDDLDLEVALVRRADLLARLREDILPLLHEERPDSITAFGLRAMYGVIGDIWAADREIERHMRALGRRQ